MDNYDFEKIDREALRQYDRCRWAKIDHNSRWEHEAIQEGDNSAFDWNPRMETVDMSPEPFVLIPVGEWDGEGLLPGTVILDDSYIVYLEIES